jgi:hypothetical protein
MNYNYELVRHIATLSEKKYSLELNLMSFGGRTPTLDIRRWERCEDGETILKGICIDDEEAKALRDALDGYLREKES